MQIHDLTDVEVEHGFGAATNVGFVTLRFTGDGHRLLGQVDPTRAREIAAHLFEAAARAEYEQDLWTAGKNAGFDDTTLGQMLKLVRLGEIARHTR